ncbi:hypothetical protein D3C85_1639360 [compost metagenome]
MEMALSTGCPNPWTPIIEAMTTIARAIMMVWLMPAMIDGNANGNWTFFSFCQLDEPKASAHSSISASTWRIPRLVRRIIGGKAYTTTAISPATLPMPSNITTGIR